MINCKVKYISSIMRKELYPNRPFQTILNINEVFYATNVRDKYILRTDFLKHMGIFSPTTLDTHRDAIFKIISRQISDEATTKAIELLYNEDSIFRSYINMEYILCQNSNCNFGDFIFSDIGNKFNQMIERFSAFYVNRPIALIDHSDGYMYFSITRGATCLLPNGFEAEVISNVKDGSIDFSYGEW